MNRRHPSPNTYSLILVTLAKVVKLDLQGALERDFGTTTSLEQALVITISLERVLEVVDNFEATLSFEQFEGV